MPSWKTPKRFSGRVITIIAASATLALTAACGAGGGSASGDESGPITFVSTGGDFQQAQIDSWQKPYTAKYGTKFVNTGPPDPAQLKTMVESGNVSWDILDQDPGTASKYCGKYLEPLDFKIIDKSLYAPDTVSKCGVPAYAYGSFILYNTKTYAKNPPTSIKAFFDLKDYPGKRIVPPVSDASVSDLLEFALLADGVAPADLYPLDVNRALKKLDTIKSQLVFAENYGQIQQAMDSQQEPMVLSLTARAALAIQGGAPYKVIWEHTFANWDDLVVAKGAAHSKEAMKFIQFVAQQAQQKSFSKAATMYPGVPSINVTYDKPSQEAVNISSPEHKKSVLYTNAAWWAKNLDDTIAKLTAWSIG